MPSEGPAEEMSSEGSEDMMPSEGPADNGPLESEGLADEMLSECHDGDGLLSWISSFFFVGKD